MRPFEAGVACCVWCADTNMLSQDLLMWILSSQFVMIEFDAILWFAPTRTWSRSLIFYFKLLLEAHCVSMIASCCHPHSLLELCLAWSLICYCKLMLGVDHVIVICWEIKEAHCFELLIGVYFIVVIDACCHHHFLLWLHLEWLLICYCKILTPLFRIMLLSRLIALSNVMICCWHCCGMSSSLFITIAFAD